MDLWLVSEGPDGEEDAVVDGCGFEEGSCSEEGLVGGGERVEEVDEEPSHGGILHGDI